LKYLALVLIVLLAAATRAATLDESDFPVKYEVMNTNVVSGGLLLGHFCTMALRDQANTGMAFIVQRTGHGSCHVWDSGAVIRGRREKSKIKLLVKDDKGKLKVEDWPITGTVAITPKSK
jgi:hypothetical protein